MTDPFHEAHLHAVKSAEHEALRAGRKVKQLQAKVVAVVAVVGLVALGLIVGVRRAV